MRRLVARQTDVSLMPRLGVAGAMGSNMRYTPLGRTGVHVSLLSLGAMTFGERNAWKLGGLAQDAVDKIVARAIDAGVNLFDTADVYDEGESETTLGRALKPWRDQVVLATKVRGRTGPGVNEIGLSRHHIRNAVRKSLERLGTTWIDLYQFHGWDPEVPLDESIEAMQDLVDDGVVIYPGLSNFAAWQIATVQARCEERGYARYETAQMSYSLLVWSPLHGGVLSGKYAKGEAPSPGSRMGDRGFTFPPFDEATGWDVVEKVRAVAKEQGCTPAQVALAWLAERKHIVLVGARSIEQLDEDLGAIDVHLIAKQLEELDALTKPRALYPRWMIERQSGGRAFPLVRPD